MDSALMLESLWHWRPAVSLARAPHPKLTATALSQGFKTSNCAKQEICGVLVVKTEVRKGSGHRSLRFDLGDSAAMLLRVIRNYFFIESQLNFSPPSRCRASWLSGNLAENWRKASPSRQHTQVRDRRGPPYTFTSTIVCMLHDSSCKGLEDLLNIRGSKSVRATRTFAEKHQIHDPTFLPREGVAGKALHVTT